VGRASDGLAAVYGEHPAAVDVAFAEHRSEVLGSADPLVAIQQVHCKSPGPSSPTKPSPRNAGRGGSPQHQRPRTRHPQTSNPQEELNMGTTLMPPFATAGTHRDRQAIEALAQANRVRLRRASLMRWMHGRSPADSHEKAAELIVEPDPTLQSMLVLQLLQRVRQVGPAQAERMLELAESHPRLRSGR
jgi:hypothetical protein